ncbi:hypothetical protein GCM10010869_51450 [Mesorhizobium tianshanense]|uniref:Uncharacterized protein n=1 Tax=Mesorhizobium tianshanense TaxID=39844 RepID=A0A562PFN1_9HYPH|nr:hypothetical protein IQ26_00160 [Mesorhizobium tianshanense]GLS39548.1 hypothetical protein GCM10010869_51450 [Mesorhizobium tianshanense]
MWKKIEIRNGAKTAEIWKTIQDSFETIFIAAGGPEDAAMYFSSESPGRDVTLYLSPGATRISMVVSNGTLSPAISRRRRPAYWSGTLARPSKPEAKKSPPPSERRRALVREESPLGP